MNINDVYIDKILSMRESYYNLVEKLTTKQDYLNDIKIKAEKIQNRLLEIKYSKGNDNSRKKEIFVEINKIEKMQKNIEKEMAPLLSKYELMTKDAKNLFDILLEKYPTLNEQELQQKINEQIELKNSA
jgi:chromosome segregation ATPase